MGTVLEAQGNLDAALAEFAVQVKGRVCADVGASTGGFTDCLLQNGAARVYAIDVGRGLLHWRLRNDPRIILMEKTNARKIKSLPEPIELVTIDAAFISLRTLLPVIRDWLVSQADIVALIKPQFEAGKKALGKQGVVRDALVHRRVVESVIETSCNLDLTPQAVMRSPLRGPKGNVEFILWCLNEAGGVELELPDELFAGY